MARNQRARRVIGRLMATLNYDGNASQIAGDLPGYVPRLPVTLDCECHAGKPRKPAASERLHRMNRAYRGTATAKRSQHAAVQRTAGV